MKDLIKQGLIELFNERSGLFSELFAELIKDTGLNNATHKEDAIRALGG
jgi:hypothetical protein